MADLFKSAACGALTPLLTDTPVRAPVDAGVDADAMEFGDSPEACALIGIMGR